MSSLAPNHPMFLASPTPESATYTASCHCGAFKYTITTSPPLSSPTARISQCNCSICVRNGYLMLYPAASDVKFLKGRLEDFKAYTFSPNAMLAHYFCGTCGSSCMAKVFDPEFAAGRLSVNVRMFEDGEAVWEGVQRRFADGKAL